MFCGLAGFSDFYKPDWLQWITRQQDRDLGCFVQDCECRQSDPHTLTEVGRRYVTVSL